MRIASRWKRLRYRLYAPFYDFGNSFDREREAAILALGLSARETILVVGAGTGADLAHLPAGARVLAIDFSTAMLAQAEVKAGPNVELRLMDGQTLDLAAGTFDAVLLHQILAVVQDPVQCLREAARVLRTGGRISVFDKFLPDGRKVSKAELWWRRALDTVFTASTWTLADLLAAAATSVTIEAEVSTREPFRTVVLRKTA